LAFFHDLGSSASTFYNSSVVMHALYLGINWLVVYLLQPAIVYDVPPPRLWGIPHLLDKGRP
jgi:hypothetical protein